MPRAGFGQTERTADIRKPPMKEHLQAIATLFSLINPVVCAMMFLSLTASRSPAQRRSDAIRAVLTIAVVLVIAALIGSRILGVFGISLDVFSVAGGIVLSFIGFMMLTGSNMAVQPDTPTPDQAGAEAGVTLAPLILFAASPGTITGVITTAAVHSKSGLPMTALIGIGVVLAVTLGVLIAISQRPQSDQPKAPSLARDMVSRYMGLIVIAMGIQYALTGYKAFMAV